MLPVFRLFKALHMFRDGLMIKYDYSAANTFQHYNSIRFRNGDPVRPDIFEGTPSPHIQFSLSDVQSQ